MRPEIPLEDGDLFLLLTDGATEAQNAEGDCFEPGQVVAKLREQPSRRIVAGLHEAAESFVPPPPCPRPDDITAVVCRAEARGPVKERHSQKGESRHTRAAGNGLRGGAALLGRSGRR